MTRPKKTGHRKLVDSRKVFPVVCLLPWVIGLVAFTLYPTVQGFIFSFCRTVVKSNGEMIMEFMGLDIYKRVLFEDKEFKMKFLIYLQQIGLLTPMIIVFSLVTAVFLNSKIRFRKGFRAIFFLPVILMQGLLYNILKELNVMEVKGLNDFFIFSFITEKMPGFISSPLMYMMSNFILVIWMSGVQILLCLAGLQRTDARIYEAASVDGATSWQCFWKITLPLSKSFIVLCGIYSVLDLSVSSINPLTDMIKNRLIDITTGFGFSAAVTWLYFILILIFVGITAFLCNGCRIREPKVKPLK
ncbi:MAG: sugar ABC transporter permease [Lachnospiraceae bacterium]|nr:sugar ABC transporter permease [Lachnospiraceae bacterium]